MQLKKLACSSAIVCLLFAGANIAFSEGAIKILSDTKSDTKQTAVINSPETDNLVTLHKRRRLVVKDSIEPMAGVPAGFTKEKEYEYDETRHVTEYSGKNGSSYVIEYHNKSPNKAVYKRAEYNYHLLEDGSLVVEKLFYSLNDKRRSIYNDKWYKGDDSSSKILVASPYHLKSNILSNFCSNNLTEDVPDNDDNSKYFLPGFREKYCGQQQ